MSFVYSREQANHKDGDEDAKLAHSTEKDPSDHLLAAKGTSDLIEAAKILRKIIINDSKTLYKECPCKPMDSLEGYNTPKWHKDRPKELVTFSLT